jgi:general secretion pathway protein J
MRPLIRPLPRPGQGFTLVEVLVALMIMSFLAVMAWQGVDGIARARDYSQSRLDQTLRLNTVMAQWDQDLASIQQGATVKVPSLNFDGNSLRLLRRTEQGLQLVIWSVRPGERPGQQQLLRWTSQPMTSSKDVQDAWARTQQFVGTEPGQLRTINGLAQWQIYYFRNNSWSNAQSTGDMVGGESTVTSSTNTGTGAGATPTTPATGAPQPPVNVVAGASALDEALPEGVRLVLTFAEGSGLQGALTRDVQLGPQWPLQ